MTPTLVTFPGVDPGWPRSLAALCAGRPWLADWCAEVVAAVAEWSRLPEQQATGWFDRDLATVLGPEGDPTLAGQAPFTLAGTTLVNLASLQALRTELPHVLADPVSATGHSAGLISATALNGDVAAADAVKLALIMGICATDVARDAGMAQSPSATPDLTPMAAVTGPTTAQLRQLLDDHPGVELAMINGRTRHAVSGRPTDLVILRTALEAFDTPVEWEPLASSVPFHHSALAPAVRRASTWAADLAFTHVTGLVAAVLASPQDWPETLRTRVPPGSTVIGLGDGSGVHHLTRAALRGTGVRVLRADDEADRRILRDPERAADRPLDYRTFRPERDHLDRVVTKHTRWTGRSPFILAGMTPTTVDAGIVAASANAGHVAELAGGGQVTAGIFDERLRELSELLEPGNEVVFNALFLDPYLWNLHLGTDRLVQKSRAAGAPICGVTISAGIPEVDEAVALLDELHGLGIWLNAFKPGNTAQVRAALAIAGSTDHPIWLHLEGGAAGGHHSWQDLDELLLETYHLIRDHDNVVLCVGGGIGNPDRAAEFLLGTWSERHGAVAMPVDAVLIGTAAMATAEATTSASVKRLLTEVPGAVNVARGEFVGGMTSGQSGLNADIHFVDNAASRAAALLDDVAGDANAVAERRDELVEALAGTAKPYFGDVSEMTYQQLLERFAELVAIGRDGRYEDGRWLDRSHRDRFRRLLQRTEARLHPQDQGSIATLFAEPHTLDDPAKAIASLVETFPAAQAAVLHPADVDHFLLVCRAPGKPVPFVPVLDQDVRRWYQSDALWQSHDDRYGADQVLVIPGPGSVGGISVVDEPVADLFRRFERGTLAGGLAPASLAPGPVDAVRSAPTIDWAGQIRPNPVRALGPNDDRVRLLQRSDDTVELVITWPALTAGDGELRLPIAVTPIGRGLRCSVSAEALAGAGRTALALSRHGGAGTDAHAAALRSGTRLPDAGMARLWPSVFSLIGTEAPDSMLDLVHLSHDITTAGNGANNGHDGIGTVAPPAEIVATEQRTNGYVFEVSSRVGDTSSVDRFFVRRPGANRPVMAAVVDIGCPEPGRDWTDTPLLALGDIRERAPEDLAPFARITGDLNPIHRSDVLARLVGLPGRIVHGMWTSALGQRAAVELACHGRADRLARWEVTFTAPVLPGTELVATVTRTGAGGGNTRVEVLIETVPADGEQSEVVAIGTATIRPPRTAYVFPGQGIQVQGMGQDGYDRSAAARAIWDRADRHCRAALGFSILQVVRENPASIVAGEPGDPRARITHRHPAGVLHLTQFTQVAMATLAAAQVEEMREAGVFDEDAITAGHSVGEYNALAAVTGAMGLEAVLDLVFARGIAMHHLVPRAADGSSDYRLGVVRPHLAGLDDRAVEALVAAVAADTGALCEIVNHNLRGKQYAVAGTVAALAELESRIGPGATGKAPFLLVPGIDVPFHSSALRPGVAEFRRHLLRHLPDRVDPAALVGRYVPNLHPEPFSVTREYVAGVRAVSGSEELDLLLADWDDLDEPQRARALLVELLAWQFASPVRWIETTELLCAGLGVERIIEIGVGTQPTLTTLTKGALALPGHRGTKPVVWNVELDTDDVFERTETALPEANVEQESEVAVDSSVGSFPVPVAVAAPTRAAVADAPADHDLALRTVVAIRTKRMLADLGDQSIEDLVDGASSRRNQLLLDIGKEFGVSAIDGAHEVPLPQVVEVLAQKSRGYRFPGPVLGSWLEVELPRALGSLGATADTLRDRVSGHWGLGAGWVDRCRVELALRSDALTGPAQAAIDDALLEVAGRLGVTVHPASSGTHETVDAAAVTAATERIERMLAGTANDLLDRIGRERVEVDATACPDPLHERLTTLDHEHGSTRAAAVAPIFDPRRHVHLESATVWARADVDHLVQGVAAGGCGPELDALTDQIATHRDADPAIGAALRWQADRAAVFGPSADSVRSVIHRVLSQEPTGIPVDLAGALATLDASDPLIARLAAGAQRITERPGTFAGEVALVTGAGPDSIALAAVRHLLRGGATVVLVTSSTSEQRIAEYRDLEHRWAGPGAQLHVITANLASFGDIDSLVEWLVTATTSDGPVARELKPELWPTILLPFAAGPAVGNMADTGPESEVSVRLQLLGVQRLIGSLGERIRRRGDRPMRVVLPLSPNHGTFGGDGAYGDTKAALETVLNRWSAEQRSWGAGTTLIGAEIGWVRGTGLMAGNDATAADVERRSGIRTFSADEMGTLIAAACAPDLDVASQRPWRVDLTGGLRAAGTIELPTTPARQAQDDEPEASTIAALPNLVWALPLADRTVEVVPELALADMIVIAGIAELGPWGGSTSRRDAELGALSADSVTELAWRMGLIEWDTDRASWATPEGGPIAEEDVAAGLAEVVRDRVGIRVFENTDGVAADGALTLAEVYLDRSLTIGGVRYEAGTAIRVPRRVPLLRRAGGQFPTDSDPTRHGLEPGVAGSMDPLAAWNLVVTAEAIASAGIAPAELADSVHPSLIGNTQGTGMGGMGSLHALHLDPVLGRSHANDLLQEALGNVVSAHVNQSLVGGYGPMVHPVAACATAAVSLEEAVDKIRLGKADIVIGGGWDDLSTEGINGFADMAATADNEELIASGISPRGHSRPGDRRRRGFVESQGGGSFVVTRGSVALRLGLPVRAVVAYAASFGDGIQTSIPAPGVGALGAARGGTGSPLAAALRAHGLTPDDIAVVSKHDTSTNANDPNEARIHAQISEAIGRTPGASLRVISQKSVTGHAKGGAAAWQLAGLCDVFETSVVPGNENLTSVDPEVVTGPLVVDHRALHRAEPVRAAVLTSLGFGHVSALIALAHPGVFESAIPEESRAEYRRVSRGRRVAGQRALLHARHGGPAIMRRRTDRMAVEQESRMLLGGAA